MYEQHQKPKLKCIVTKTETDPITGSRFYFDDKKQRYISVTTLLKHYEDLNSLYDWQERIGKEEADAISTEFADIGNQSHAQVEHYLDTKEVLDSFTSYSRNAIEHFYIKTTPVMYEEPFLYTDSKLQELKYGGRFDQLLYLSNPFYCIDDPNYIIKDRYVIADLKTKRKSIRLNKADQLFKYCLQQAAYSKAVNSLQDDITVKGGIVVIATKKTIKLLYLDQELLDYYWDIFYRMLLDYYLIEPLKKTWKEMVDEASMYYDVGSLEISTRLPRIIT